MWIAFLISFLLMFSPVYATEADVFDISNFADTMKGFNSELIDEDYEELINGIREGNFEFDYKKIFGNAGKFLVKELRSNLGLAVQIVLISVIMGLLNNLKSSFSADGVSQIAFYVCYIILVTLLISSFTNIYNIAKDFVVEISSFMNVLTPIIIGLIASTGGITTSSMIYPVIAFFSQFITLFVSKLLLPVSIICFALGVVTNISNKVSVSRVSNFLKSASMWILGIILTVFVGIVSLEGTVASTVDGVTVKTAKFLFSGSVPVVGKLLGDTVDTILGSTLVIKDAIGFVGVMVLLGLALVPIIKVLVVVTIYSLTGAIIEPFADDKICKCLSGVSEAGGVILSMLITICVMFIIGTVMLLKISNFAVG